MFFTGFMRAGAAAVFAALTLAMLAPAHVALGADNVDSVVAKLNDEIITNSDLREFLNDRSGSAKDKGITRENIEAFFDRALLLQMAKKMQITVPESDLQTNVEESVKEIRSRYPNEKTFLAALNEEGQTLAQFKAEMYKRTVIDFKVSRVISARFSLSESDVSRFDSESRAKGNIPLSLHLRRLAVVVAGKGSAAESKAKQKVSDLLARIYGEGLSFTDGVKKYTEILPEREAGGDLGFIPANKLSKEVLAATENLEAGKASQPLIAGGNACIFYVESKRGARHVVFEQRFSEERKKLLSELRRKAHLSVYDPRITKVLSPEYTAILEAGQGN